MESRTKVRKTWDQEMADFWHTTATGPVPPNPLPLALQTTSKPRPKRLRGIATHIPLKKKKFDISKFQDASLDFEDATPEQIEAMMDPVVRIERVPAAILQRYEGNSSPSVPPPAPVSVNLCSPAATPNPSPDLLQEAFQEFLNSESPNVIRPSSQTNRPTLYDMVSVPAPSEQPIIPSPEFSAPAPAPSEQPIIPAPEPSTSAPVSDESLKAPLPPTVQDSLPSQSPAASPVITSTESVPERPPSPIACSSTETDKEIEEYMTLYSKPAAALMIKKDQFYKMKAEVIEAQLVRHLFVNAAASDARWIPVIKQQKSYIQVRETILKTFEKHLKMLK